MKRRSIAVFALSGALALFGAGIAFGSDGNDALKTSEELVAMSKAGYEVAAPRSSNDVGWSFYMNFRDTDGAYPQKKEDDTSVYVYVQYKNMDRYNIYVDGVDNTNGSGRLACTDNGEAYVFKVGEFQIYNHVYENHKRYAQLTGYASYEGGSTGGLWSPDSVGYYPIINKGY